MPVSWLSVLVFLVFVAPGVYFEQISSRHRVRAKESAFQEVSRTVIASVAISIPAGLAALAVWTIVTDMNAPNFGALLRRDNAYIGSHIGSIAAAILGYLLASVICAKLGNRLLARQDGTSILSMHTLWTELFRVKKGADQEVAVRVVMKSGQTWSGIVGNFSAHHETEHRELVLYKPILFSATAEAKPTLQEQDVVLLTGAEITSIGINYTPK